MEEIIIYEKPTCSTCRVAISLVDKSGKPHRRIRYYEDKLSREKLAELVSKLGVKPAELVRMREPLYKELGLNTKEMSDEEVIDVLVKYPDLLQRPILEYEDRAILGRPVENVSKFLKEIKP